MEKKIKLFESPNYTMIDNVEITAFSSRLDVTFFYYDGEFISGDSAHVLVFKEYFPEEYKNIPTLEIYNLLKNAGRCFTSRKVMTFWNFPTTIEEFKKVITDLEKTKNLKIWNNDWRVEVVVDEEGNQIVGNMWSLKRSTEGNSEKLIPLEDYLLTYGKKVIYGVSKPASKQKTHTDKFPEAQYKYNTTKYKYTESMTRKILPFKLFENPDQPNTFCEQTGDHFDIYCFQDDDAFPFGYVKIDDITKFDTDILNDLDVELEDVQDKMKNLEDKRNKKSDQIEKWRVDFSKKYSTEEYNNLSQEEKTKLESEESKLLDEFNNIRIEIRELKWDLDAINNERTEKMDEMSDFLDNFNMSDVDEFFDIVEDLPEYKGYKMMCGSSGSKHLHLGTSRNEQLKNGRIWAESKYITFWEYPKDYDELIKVIQDIDESMRICQGYELNIYENREDWFIEMPGGWREGIYYENYVIPLTQYKGGEQRKPEELAKLHFDPKAREVEAKRKLKAGEDVVKKGWGSRNMKNKREWRQALGESIMTFEDYSHMNYPDLYDEPVSDYVDTEYYNTNVIEEDPEDDVMENPGLNKRSVGIRRKPKSKFSAE